jgi:hypothetical protein
MQKRFISSVGGCTLVLAALACNTKNITDINTDPNNPVDAPAGALFTNAAITAAHWVGNGRDLRATEFVAQHLAEVQYPDEDRYSRLQGPSTTSYFDNAYFQELQDLRKVIQKGQSETNPAIWGPATVLQIWTFENLTDIWGDIPYAQALGADSTGGTLTPVYDKQQDIYTSFFSRLADAVAAMEATDSTGLGSADPLYGGDVKKWVKFANSLRARLAMHVVNVDPGTANTQLTAALSDPGGVFASNDDNAKIVWPGDGVYDNPWADNFKTRDDHRMSNTLMNLMVPYGDPRVPIYAQPVLDSTIYPNGFGGMPNGLNADTAGTWFNVASRPGLVFYPGATSYGPFGDGSGLRWPSFIMTYAEVMFIKAEAAQRSMGGLTPAEAATDYYAGIQASMDQWGVTDEAAVTAFEAKSGIAYTPGIPAGLDQIAIQKYVAFYSDGTQAWVDWRRTCEPVTLHAGPNAIVDFIPRRFEYSQTEYSVNGANVNAALAQMGGQDDFATRMWWDSNPTAAPTHTASCNEPTGP